MSEIDERAGDIVRLLACPACGGPHLIVDASSARCPLCSREYRRRGSAWNVSPPGAALAGLESKMAPGRNWRRLLRPGLSLNVNRARLLDMVRVASAEGAVLDLGSGERRLGDRVVNLELDLFPNVDVIGSALALPFIDGGFALVVCQAVMEHVSDPRCVVDEIGRVLQAGGRVYAEIPFMQGYHADPHDYQRFTISGIRTLFANFEEVECGVCVGPASAFGWMLTELAGLIVPTRVGKIGVRFAVGWFAALLKQCDRWLARRPDAHRIAGGLYFLGRKAPTSDAVASTPAA